MRNVWNFGRETLEFNLGGGLGVSRSFLFASVVESSLLDTIPTIVVVCHSEVMEAVTALNSLISSLPSPPLAPVTTPPSEGPVASYYQQGSVSLLNDLIAELEFSLSSFPTLLTDTATPTSSLDPNETSLPLSAAITSSVAVVPEVTRKQQQIAAAGASAAESTSGTSNGNGLSINSLDIRVGQIVRVQRHETADKLYCEDILVGEEAPRAIASGLVPYYSLEEMMSRRVLVVCNLKPRSLVGFKSSGMVLCASVTDADGNHKVEFIDPPTDAPIGSRVIGESLDFIEPLSVKQCDKLKAFNLIAPDLSVNDKGEVVWNGHRLVTEGGAVCTAPTLRNCPVA